MEVWASIILSICAASTPLLIAATGELVVPQIGKRIGLAEQSWRRFSITVPVAKEWHIAGVAVVERGEIVRVVSEVPHSR